MNGYRPHGGVLVCIDTYEDGVMTGRILDPRFGEGETFRSTVELLRRIGQLLDLEDTPQSFTAARSFAPGAGLLPELPEPGTPEPGRLATLELRILFRRNASWQGSIRWLEGKQEQRFRSVLELILLIDSALGGVPERQASYTR